MESGGQKPASTGNKIKGWIFAFLIVVVVCLLLLGMQLLRDSWTDALDASGPASDGPATETAASGRNASQPSVQAKDVASVDSVQSVQSVQAMPSVQSVQSVQGASGLALSDIGMLELADLKARDDLPAEWRNILLLGSDSRDMKMMSLFDTIIIASINKTTGEMKLTSILRDTEVPIPGRGMQRINTAAYYGGPSLMMQVINANFGMNITEYALVNFAGMAKAIDALGGINLDVNQKEMEQINLHMGEIATYTMDKADYLAKREEMKLKAPGANVPVNGIQAVSYARIRSIDSDAARAGRQRLVIARMLEHVKAADPSQLLGSAAQMWGDIVTNIDMPSAVALAGTVQGAGGSKDVSEFTIPCTTTRQSKDGALIDVDLAENALRLHDFIYGGQTA